MIQAEQPQSKGKKRDPRKVRLELLSTTWLMGVGAVASYMEEEASSEDGRESLHMPGLLGEALRHVFLYLGGEVCDQKSKLGHLYHASYCLMLAVEKTAKAKEDFERVKKEMTEVFRRG